MHQVVHGRGSGEHGPGGDHRARLDHGFFVNPVFPPTSTSSSTMTGKRPRARCHAPNLRRRAHVDARPDLRARPDERVRVDQRARANVGADVHVHRGHADEHRRRGTRRRAPTIPQARRARCARGGVASAAACPCRRTGRGRDPSRRRQARLIEIRGSTVPCLTQVLTRHPDAADASGSAARTTPCDRASRSAANAARISSRSGAGVGHEREDPLAQVHGVTTPCAAPAGNNCSARSTSAMRARDAGCGGTIGRR